MFGLYGNRPYSSNNVRIYGTTGVTEVKIDERSFWARPVSIDVLESGHMVSEALSQSLGQSFPWAVGFFFANPELALDLWTLISGIDD